DPSFGTAGRVTTDFGGFDYAAALVLQPDGKLVAMGVSHVLSPSVDRLALARYLTGTVGGSGLGISPDAGRNRLSWSGSGDELGYLMARDPTADAVLPA